MVTGVHAVPRGGTGGGAAGPGGRGGVRAGSPGELPHRPGHGRLHPGHRLHRGRNRIKAARFYVQSTW